MTTYADTFGQDGLNHLVDADALLKECGIDSEEIEWRKEFIGFTDEDARRLAAMEDRFEDHADAIAEDFYDNLTDYEQTMEVIGRSEKGVEMLKETQRAYLVTLASGEYGMDYFQNRARIGKIHDLLEMPMKHYLGQYGVYYDLIFDVLRERIADGIVEAIVSESDTTAGGATAVDHGESLTLDRGDLREAVGVELDDGLRDVLAVLRIINLDMQVVADTYIHSYSQQLEEALDENERLMEEIARDVETPIDELTTPRHR
jgi:hypothetical protein